jgi:oligosaccharide repeat unit polymerase
VRENEMTVRVRPHMRGGTRVIRLASIFSPLTLVVFLYTPLLLLYAVSSEGVFETEFDSRKTLTWSGFAFFALALLCFAAGAKAGEDQARAKARAGEWVDRELTAAQRRSLAVLLEAALVLTILAYVLWFARGFARAGGVSQFLEIWRRDPLFIKTQILTTVPGVTTLIQVAVATIPLAIAFKLYRRGSVVPVLVALAIVLGAARALFFSERLALIELLLPIVFLLLAPRRITIPRVVLYAIVLLLAVMTFFAATELRRSYAYTHDFSASTSATRFAGYYLTPVNNGMAVIDHYPGETPLYSSAQFLWLFPGLRDLRVEHFPAFGTVSLRYADVFGVDPEEFWPRAFGDQGLNYEFNVFSAPGHLAADFGWGALIAVFLLGLLSGTLYARSETSVFHRALYAVWLVGLLEFMRILYFTNTRVFPAYLVFAAAYVVVRRRAGAGLAISESAVPAARA